MEIKSQRRKYFHLYWSNFKIRSLSKRSKKIIKTTSFFFLFQFRVVSMPQLSCFIIQPPRRVFRVYWLRYSPGNVFLERASGASSLVGTGLKPQRLTAWPKRLARSWLFIVLCSSLRSSLGVAVYRVGIPGGKNKIDVLVHFASWSTINACKSAYSKL